MEDPSTPALPNISPSISQELMINTCTKLSRFIKHDDNNDYILDVIWSPVNKMLRQDKNLKLTTEEEFLEKAKNYPDGDFISKVKNLANAAETSVTSWGGLFREGTYFIFSACSAPIIPHI